MQYISRTENRLSLIWYIASVDCSTGTTDVCVTSPANVRQVWVPPNKRSKYIIRLYLSTGNISAHVLDIPKLKKAGVVE